MKRQNLFWEFKGSMTVEAVFVMSLILLVILWIMKSAIALYGETMELTLKNQAVLKDAAGMFRKLFFAGEFLP